MHYVAENCDWEVIFPSFFFSHFGDIITILIPSAGEQYSMDADNSPQLYDLVFPPGTPQSIIRDIVNNYDIELVESPERLKFANMDGDVRNLIAARGRKETMMEVEAYFKKRLKEFIEG